MTLIRTLIASALLGIGLSVGAQEPVFDSAYEVALERFRLPASELGFVSLRIGQSDETGEFTIDSYRNDGVALRLQFTQFGVLIFRQMNPIL